MKQPFTVENLYTILNEYAWNRITLTEVADSLNGMAENFFRYEITGKGVIMPYTKSNIRQQLLHLEIGESIYTEDEHYRNRTKSQANRIMLDFGYKYSTLKNGNGWRTWRLK